MARAILREAGGDMVSPYNNPTDTKHHACVHSQDRAMGSAALITSAGGWGPKPRREPHRPSSVLSEQRPVTSLLIYGLIPVGSTL